MTSEFRHTLRGPKLILIAMACLQVAACSTYDGPITNAHRHAGADGLPGLTNYYAP